MVSPMEITDHSFHSRNEKTRNNTRDCKAYTITGKVENGLEFFAGSGQTNEFLQFKVDLACYMEKMEWPLWLGPISNLDARWAEPAPS